MKSDSIKEKVAQVLDLPKEIVLNLSKVIIYGNRVLRVENFCSLTDYSEERILLKTEKGIVQISGKNLRIQELNGNEINILGEFTSIQFGK